MTYSLLFSKIEKWTIKEDEITTELLDLKLQLEDVYYYPGLFLVNFDYCESPSLQRKSTKANKKSMNRRRERIRKKIPNF